jgi:hypothetical protein
VVIIVCICSPPSLQDGLNLAIKFVSQELPVLAISLDGTMVVDDHDKVQSLRAAEKSIYELNDDGFTTRMTYNHKNYSVQNALFSIYTTSFIIVLLVVRIPIFVPVICFPTICFFCV